ncbi:hypothetical protein HDR59_01165 [bacterium]|nr:hypothetical protein [bacterium]
MLNVSKKYFEKDICEKYVSNVERIIYSKKSVKSKYNKLLIIKKEFENDKVCESQLSDDAKQLISYVINLNVRNYKKLSDRPSSLQMFIKGMGSIHL